LPRLRIAHVSPNRAERSSRSHFWPTAIGTASQFGGKNPTLGRPNR
jgi:hypothetical protein